MSDFSANPSFMCVKCRCRQSITKEGSIANSGFIHLFTLQHSKYVFVSCINCGYTEIYNVQIIEQIMQKEKEN